MHQTSRDDSVVTQQTQEPVVVHHVAQPAIVQQTGVGIRCVTDVFEQLRQDQPLHLTTSPRRGCQRTDMTECPLGLRIAERGQAPLRRLVRQRQFSGVQADRGLEQRSVEELLVQSSYPQALVLDLPAQHRRCVEVALPPDVRGAGKPPHVVVVVELREQVGTRHALQLQPVFEQPEELIRRIEVGAVVAADVSTRRQRIECLDGRSDPQRLVDAAVDHLQHLHGELDVANTATA